MLQFEELEKLQSAHHARLLDVVDALRAQGLSDFFPLPQLIVCGDQSAGKSSVLEEISGVPFPKKDQLCTRFATEVILRRNDALDDTSAAVSIIPGSSRSDTDRQNLLQFKRNVENMDSLPEIISLAKDAMGLGSMGNAFSTDVLRLEVSGPMIPQLTIVDLPGLIHSENKMQTAEDVELVTGLVEGYMKQERSIILAIVSAKYDIANQIVLKKARAVDSRGERTLGIITKPDSLYPGSTGEEAFLELARNQDVKFSLGWHVLRNVDSNNAEEVEKGRLALEKQFFARPGWRALPANTRGVETLLERLSNVLFQQIRRELPSLTLQIEEGLGVTLSGLQKLGKARSTQHEQRDFLAGVADVFQKCCTNAYDGSYDSPFFALEKGSGSSAKRLRAAVQNSNAKFAQQMMTSGSLYPLPTPEDDTDDPDSPQSHATLLAKELVQGGRGRELPGMFNPLLVGDLFRQYSIPWAPMTLDYVEKVWKTVKRFVMTLLREISDNDVGEACMRTVLEPQLDEIRQEAIRTSKKIFEELSRHPITYNKDFIQAYMKLKNDRLMKQIQAASESNRHDLVRVLVSALSMKLDETDSAAAENLVDYMVAYYKIALNRFVDNVAAQVIEPVILSKLPQLFTVKTAWSMDLKQLEEITAESKTTQQTREQLSEHLKILQQSEKICRSYISELDGDLDGGSDTPDTDLEENDVEPLVSEDELASCTELKNEEDTVTEPAEEAVSVEIKEPQDAQEEFWGFSSSTKKKKSKKHY